MAKQSWNRITPNDIPQALQLSVDHGREKKNLSIQRIADLMGVSSQNTLYGWLSSGRMPLMMVPAFEHATGINLVTRFLAHGQNKLLVEMPTGKRAQNHDIANLVINANQTFGQLMRFFDGEESAHDVSAALKGLMEDLEKQRRNLDQYKQPELLLGGAS